CQSRAARPMPPYTTRSSGRSATSGSRLFWITRYAASVSQERQDSSLPRGARMLRDGSWRGSGRVSGMEGSRAETVAPRGCAGRRLSHRPRRGRPAPETSAPGGAGRGVRLVARSADRRIQPAQRVGKVSGTRALDVLAGVHASSGRHAFLALLVRPRVARGHKARTGLLDAEPLGCPVLARFPRLLHGLLLRFGLL